MSARREGITPLNISQKLVNDEAPNGSNTLDAALVRARATKLLTEGGGALVQSCAEPMVPFATALLLKLASEAVHELLEQQREAVARGCGGQITKDRALGTLLGDLLGISLLPEEACKVGKAAATQLKSSKDHDKANAGNAAAKRAQARKSASKSAERATSLDDRLASIDAARDAARGEIWAKRVSLPLPEGQLVQSRVRPPKSKPEPMPEPMGMANELAAARAALTAAFSAQAQAQRGHNQATRALARLQPPNFAGKQESNFSTMSDTAFATYCAAKSKASETEGALRLAELEVKGAEQRLDLEFNLAEVEKKAAAERAARQRERQAKAEAKAEAAAAGRTELADADRRRELFHAAFDAWQAGRRWYRMSRHLHMCAALSEIEAAEARDATRARLEADAAKVWGSADKDKENSPGQVISLVGMSPESLRAAACSRGVRQSALMA